MTSPVPLTVPAESVSVTGLGHDERVKRRHLRIGDELSDATAVVVRGGLLDSTLLRDDALRNHSIYGTYGVSVFAVRDLTVDELMQLAPLIRFPHVTVVRVGALRAAGLRLEPTGRNPRHYDIAFDDLAEGVRRLCGCEHDVVANPYHEP